MFTLMRIPHYSLARHTHHTSRADAYAFRHYATEAEALAARDLLASVSRRNGDEPHHYVAPGALPIALPQVFDRGRRD